MSEIPCTDKYEIPETGRLRLFIDDEIIKGRKYALLAQRCHSDASLDFDNMRANTQASVAELETEYFLLTGDSYPGTKTSVNIDGVLGGMRDIYICELLSAKELIHASEGTSSELAKVYLESSVLARQRGHSQAHGIDSNAIKYTSMSRNRLFHGKECVYRK